MNFFQFGDNFYNLSYLVSFSYDLEKQSMVLRFQEATVEVDGPKATECWEFLTEFVSIRAD